MSKDTIEKELKYMTTERNIYSSECEELKKKLAKLEYLMQEYPVDDEIDLKNYIEDLRYLNKKHNEEIKLLTKRWEKLKMIVKKKVDNLPPPNWYEWEEMQCAIQDLEKENV